MKKLLNVVLIVLAVFGVLFIILMFIPDDENEEETTVTVQEETSQSEEPQPAAQTADAVSEEPAPDAEDQSEESAETSSDAADQPEEDADQSSDAENQSEEVVEPTPDPGNTVQVNIPASELSGEQMRFKTLSLDDEQVTQDIFSGYDLTLVHMWGTYCGPCIKEMGEYAALYKELPDNVNLVGLIIDVYDGLDNNVSNAEKILNDAGAEFTNMRTSDGLNNVLEKISYVPSSFFVNREGQIVGEIMDGAGFDETKARLDSYLK